MHSRMRLVLSTIVVLGLSGRVPAQKQPVLVVDYGSLAAWSTHIFIADGDGQHAHEVLAQPDYEYNPSLSSDGHWIVFTSERGGAADLYRVQADRTRLERLTDDPAYDDQGILSPNGGSLAFVSSRSGHSNIWLLDLRTRKTTNLTPGSPGDYSPAWSPDGETIAFSSIRDAGPRADRGLQSGSSYALNVYVVHKDGTRLRRLTAPEGSIGSPSWSRDGTRIVCYEHLTQPERWRVVSIDVADGRRAVLSERPNNTWMPQWISSSRVAYVFDSVLGAPAGVAFTDGAASLSGDFGGARWSADGRRMVFHRDTAAELPSYPGTPSRDPQFQIMRTGLFPSSPARDALVVMNSARAGAAHNAILAARPDGSGRRVIFDDPARNAVAPIVSPDGRQVAFALGDVFQAARQDFDRLKSHLAVVNVDGSGFRELPAAGDHAGYPSWSPRGDSLVYANAGPGDTRGLRLLDLQSGRVSILTRAPDIFPAWSPRGDRIAFTSSRDGLFHIYTVRPDGSGLTKLTTSSSGQNAHPAWSPDGGWIAFTSSRGEPRDERGALFDHLRGEIYVMRPDGTDVRRLTDNQHEDGTPGWLPTRAARP